MKTLFLAALLLVAAWTQAQAQVSAARPHHAALASHILVPHGRAFTGTTAGQVTINGVDAAVDILEQVATTTLEISVTNVTGARQEATLLVPVPDGAALRGFTFHGTASEPTAELLPRDEARRLYDAIVAKTRDPALLEFVGQGVVRSSVFPVEPRGVQKIRLTYEHLLPADGERVDYTLPRTESVEFRVPWRFKARIRSKTPIATVYSPSHALEKSQPDERTVMAHTVAEAAGEPGSIRLSYLLRRGAMTASLLAYPDPKIGGGYFLLLAGAPARAVAAAEMKREVILVIDRSGSMAGEKLEQARAAALQVIEGLADGEAFNIVVYHESVESFAPDPVIKTAATMRAAREYLRGLRVRGGTNIHDALVEALRQKRTPGFLPLVLFLTDGLPTVGTTSEKSIREVASKANPHDRRVFTFGVGVDVNTPLLDRIAQETRAAATYVLPREDVEVKVGQVFKRLSGPVLAAPRLKVVNGAGEVSPGRVRDLIPVRLPDLFEGDQLVLLGQYVGTAPLNFVLEGEDVGTRRSFDFHFALDQATTRNAFVPRLWATRQIASLTQAIRDLGAESGDLAAAGGRPRELVDEIVRLSKEFGVLTEYTAFLAKEGTDLTRPADVARQAWNNFQGRAVSVRSGAASVNQSFNYSDQVGQSCVNPLNRYWDAGLNRVEVSAIQQVNDRAFYRRSNRWVDSSLVDREAAPTRTVTIGSPEFSRLAADLAAQGRQGCIALSGEILLNVDGETILVR